MLPKVHKTHGITKLVESNPVDYPKNKDPPEIPSRPIIAGLSSLTHDLSKFLDTILRPLTEKVKSYVCDDIEFLSHLPKKIDFESTFVTLDVTSLYTNISHEHGIEAISYSIEAYPNYLADDRFTKDIIIDGLLLVLKNNYFQFNNTMWHQLIGTAMGTNVAVIYAILFMAYLEQELYHNVRNMYPQDYSQYIINAWKRFIDDCFLIWNNNYNFKTFLDMANSLDISISFTVGTGKHQLPFLDIMVIKNRDNSISTDIFYKSTNSHRYLDFRSCQRHHTKVNVPFNLAQRICKIVSNNERKIYRLKELK